MTKIRDRIWLLGEQAGSHHAGSYNLPGKNIMEPHAGCDFFGINKCCRVQVTNGGPYPPFDNESEKIKNLKEVVWSAVGSFGIKSHNNDQSELPEILRQAEMYPNITGAILDDFFPSVECQIQGNPSRHTVESIRKMRKALHEFPKRKLDLWLVWYEYQLDYDVQEYLDLVDVVSLWIWNGHNLVNLDDNIKKMVDKTPDKRHFIGCYPWNYGRAEPLSMDLMKYQMERFHHWVREGVIEGMIICSNCIADIGLDTVDYTKKWIEEFGDEDI